MPFSEQRADRAVGFIEGYLRHTKGQYAGQPFILRDWQKEHIREIFGRLNDDGTRQVRQVYWEIPKKNGKSEIAAAIALTLLYTDREQAAEIYGAAVDRDQASIVFNLAASMVRANRRLSSRSNVIDSSKRIAVPRLNSVYRALSADVSGKHGFNSHGVIFDEIHAQKDRRLWEVLTFGAGDARRQPLIFGITTAGIPGESPVAEELHEYADQILRGIIPPDPTFYPVIYAAPLNADWTSEEVWRACNPALGDFLNLESVRGACERAKRIPSEQNSFRRLRLDQWLSQETRFIDMADWDRCAGVVDLAAAKELTWYGGLDLSTKLDVTALVLVSLTGDGRFNVLPHFWIPKDNLSEVPSVGGQGADHTDRGQRGGLRRRPAPAQRSPRQGGLMD
jgi:phage terminase large subunit-like protein